MAVNWAYYINWRSINRRCKTQYNLNLAELYSSWSSSWSREAWIIFWCVVGHPWARWLGLCWWEVNIMCCFRVWIVQGSRAVWQTCKLYSSHGVHGEYAKFHYPQFGSSCFLLFLFCLHFQWKVHWIICHN